MPKFTNRLNAAPSAARKRLCNTSALAGSMALMLMALPATAFAEGECGAASLTGGTVTCTPAGNPYNDGITYIAPPADLTIVLQDGVRVDTSGTFNIGVLAVGGAAITVDGGTNTIITTDSDGGFGALVANDVDPLSVTLDQVITSGTNAIGVIASSSEGAVTVGTNAITTSGDNAAGISTSTDIGAITVRSGSITTSGFDAAAIDANSDFGDISVTSDSIQTSGDGSGGFFGTGATGILASTGGIGQITINSAAITTAGSDAAGIRAQNDTGALSVTSGTIATTGLNADGINAVSAGTVTINSGAITTAGANADGIFATGGTGANIVFTSITTTGDNANGVLVPAGVPFFGPRASAAANVTGQNVSTAGAGSDGIRAIAGTDMTTVNVSGNVATQGANSRGIFATGPMGVTVTSGGTISTAGIASNGVDASSLTGPVTVTVRNVTATGDGSRAVLAEAAAGNAAVSVNGALSTTGALADVLTVNSGANGTVNVAAGGSFAATQGNFITMNSAGTSTLNNAGTIGNNTSGFALLAAGGPITINNTGNLSSDIVLTPGADILNNSGTFTVGVSPDFGAGIDAFNNTGRIVVGNGAAAPVAVVFTGLESLTNSGTIDMRNGRTGDSLSLPGTYIGSNGTLGLDVTLGTNPTTSDQLIVGGVASGSTTVALNLLGAAPVFTSGTVLVRAAPGSTATAFDLAGGSLDAGFVRYEIQYNTADSSYVLTGAPSDTAFRTLNYVEGTRSLWLKSADVVSAQLRAQRDALWSLGGGEATGRLWAQIHGSVETREGQRNFNAFGQSRLTNTGYQQDYFGGQLGLDISGGNGERGGFAFGITGGYLNSSLNFAGSADRLRFDVVNGGVYGSFSAGNFFVNALGKYDYYWADASAPTAAFQQDFNGGVYGGRAEAGLRLGNDSFFIEPAASISYVKNDFDDLAPAGSNVRFDEDEGLRGRAGGRIGSLFDLGGSEIAVYVGGNYVHEFQGRDRVIFTGGGQTLSFTNNRLRDYGEATLGVTIAQSQGISGFIEGNYTRSFSKYSGNLGIEGAGGRAGIRFKF
jgi:trimeric autotransporter adhesin